MINWYERAKEFMTHYIGLNKSDCVILERLLKSIGEENFNQLVEDTKDQTYDNTGEDYSFTAFHKRFRQTDVSGNTDIDWIFWHFVHISKLPQTLYYGIQNKNYDGTPCDPEFLYFDGQFLK